MATVAGAEVRKDTTVFVVNLQEALNGTVKKVVEKIERLETFVTPTA